MTLEIVTNLAQTLVISLLVLGSFYMHGVAKAQLEMIVRLQKQVDAMKRRIDQIDIYGRGTH